MPDLLSCSSLLLLLCVAVTGCGTVAAPSSSRARAALFTEQKMGSEETLIWPDGSYQLPEITGGGVALFDCDGDDRLDLLLVQSPPPGSTELVPCQMFRQRHDGTFEDVTQASGLAVPLYGQGVTVGDVDNDGDADVYLTALGEDRFFLNNGRGTFTESTAARGFRGDPWSVSAAFFDYDRDGDLDLFVVHYVVFDPHEECLGDGGAVDYCGPQNFPGTLDSLYRNEGDGTFVDVSREAGITAPGKGLGLACADFTGDGWPDVYVANDGEANHLWINNQDGTFREEAILRGAAFNGKGDAEASMGVAVGDVDGWGTLDLLLTHLTNETNTLYINEGDTGFFDRSHRAGLSAADLPMTGFGCGLFDADNDGDLDLAVVNGRVKRGRREETGRGAFWNAYAQPNLLFANDGGGKFREITEHSGRFGQGVEVSRGLAHGDVDDDGDLDLVVGNLFGPPRLYRNQAHDNGNHWLGIRALTNNRDAIGAALMLDVSGRRRVRIVVPGQSYASHHDPRVHFGLGAVDRVSELHVHWIDGTRERFPIGTVDRYVTLRQGEGTAE